MEDYYGTRRKRNLDLSQFIQEGNTTIHTQTGWANEDNEFELEEGYEEASDEEVEMGFEEIDDDMGEMVEEADTATWEESEPELEIEIANHPNGFLIDGEPFVPKQKPKKKKFSETHSRYTTYIDKNVLAILRMLQDSNQIESITKCINDSIKEYLMNHYQDEN